MQSNIEPAVHVAAVALLEAEGSDINDLDLTDPADVAEMDRHHENARAVLEMIDELGPEVATTRAFAVLTVLGVAT